MENLKDVFASTMRKSKEVLDQFPWENSYAYAMWLKQTHHFVENSTRLIALAGSRFTLEQNDYHRRFLEHCSEEISHEKLLIHDIKSLGFDPMELPVLAETAAFYQCQHYWIERVSPMSFYGYILFLEGLAANHGKDITRRVVSQHGVRSATFFKVHSEEDENHLEEAFTRLSQISKIDELNIVQNFKQCSYFYLGFLKEISKQPVLNKVSGL